jgi:hypothetical protein
VTLPVTSLATVALGVYYLAAVVLTHFNKPAGAIAVVLGLVIFHRPLGRLLGVTLLDSWRKLNEEAALSRQDCLSSRAHGGAAQEPTDGATFDFRPLVVLCAVAVSLTVIEYYGDRSTFRSLINRWLPDFLLHRFFDLASFGYWSGFRVVGYVLFPWLVVLFMKGERLRDYGLSLKGFFKHLWIYGLLFLIVVFPVVMVSFTKSFQNTYPFYKLAARSWTDFLLWEAMYSLQFFALEVFFRGFMLHPLKKTRGAYAIFAMAGPYCMIHFNKPLAEVLGAVVAGIVLGTLSLRTGSIWCGVLIHISVALSMDSLSMVHVAGYPGNPRLVL